MKTEIVCTGYNYKFALGAALFAKFAGTDISVTLTNPPNARLETIKATFRAYEIPLKILYTASNKPDSH